MNDKNSMSISVPLRWDFRAGDLFLNMGVVLLPNGNLQAAMDALQHAVGLDSSQPESHYNLGLVYERRDMLAEAEKEMIFVLRLGPRHLEAQNMLGGHLC